ncbi:hypothetical protein PFISCL1PPCAC_10160 [Pristionchus fissidentatus]|uniref:CCR4-NOT transcription complex subunit 1 n=1 Tax=Pristionchus fissidentatus TaxID=1538716 RepID=A0AAV5VKS1_9BILA|nr:hypothetical protein PFISCL1PPCAC_10160 [Pristionchus fissidentatus]
MMSSSTRLSDLLSYCYIDDLLAASNPPRSLSFLLQRLLVVSSRGGASSADHTISCLLSILEYLPLPESPRPSIDAATAAGLIHLIVKLSSHSSETDQCLVKGGERLFSSLEKCVSLIKPVCTIDEIIENTSRKFFSGPSESSETTMDSSPSSRLESSAILGTLLVNAGPAATQSEQSLRSVLSEGGITGTGVSVDAVATAIVSILNTRVTPVMASFDRPVDSTRVWDGRVLATVMNEMNPSLNWSEVFIHLDTPLFTVKDRAALLFLTNAFNTAFCGKSWPMSLLYREWRVNKMGQVSWLQQMVENADVCCLSEHTHRPVNTHTLKVQYDDPNKEVANWKCLDLTDTLLKLSDSMGPAENHRVTKVFHTGLAVCPDIVLLAFLQLPGPLTESRLALMNVFVPHLISTHYNVVPVLNLMWNNTHLPKTVLHNIIIQALSNYYVKNSDDQAKLTKILDIAHELKPSGLSELFELTQFPFTIDLACLASKRDYLKLEKWLEDKEQVHGESFVMAVMHHMKRRLPSSAGGGCAYMNQEMFSTLNSFMVAHSGKSSATRLEYNQLLNHMTRLQMRNEPNRPGSGAGPSSRMPSMPFRGAPMPPGRPFGVPPSDPQPPPPTLNNAFGGSGLSMSPSNQMMRSSRLDHPPMNSQGVGLLFGGGGAAPARQENGGWRIGAPPPIRNTPGATTPSSSIDFRPVLNPGAQALNDLSEVRGSGSMEEISTVFSDRIQQEANMYFEKIYSHNNPMSVTELLNKLKQFKMSNQPKDKQVLQCVVKNLFEEYRFFKEYPERELKITAEVYGGIIRENIISNLHFATAVRKMVESLQAEINSMLWLFGIVALNTCKAKLYNYPKVCLMISGHDNFHRMPEQLKAYVTAGLNGQLPMNVGRESPAWLSQATTPAAGPAGAATAAAPSLSAIGSMRNSPGHVGGAPGGPHIPSLAPRTFQPGSAAGAGGLSYNVTNVDTLVQSSEATGSVVQPPREELVDNVSFLFNNLSLSNLQAKRDEMRRVIHEEGEPFLKWLSQYIVMKRVSIEQNFQPLYNQFVCAIDNPLLDKFIKEETFRNIRILLRSDKRQAASNYNERQLLKNLGMWLGSISIAKNRPIVVQDLDLKSLLLEAYYKGQQELLYVIPFIAKILLSCAKTSLFSPSCAWIRALLKLLAELHNEPDLKINLKFEIEVLCKELSVDLATLPVEGVLKDTEKLVKVPQQLSDLKQLTQPAAAAGSSPIPPQMRQEGVSTPPAPLASDTNRSTPVSMDAETSGGNGGAAAEPAPAPATFHYADINVVSIEGIVPHLKISASLPLFQVHPQLKQMVRVAVTHAIKELIGPVTERALKVALTVTENVIKKDFCLNPDEQQLRKSAHSMMRAMTAGMAAITCREPLSASMVGYLNQAFGNNHRGSQSPELTKMFEEAAHQIMNDNVELTTNFIVKTACEKASAELDKRLEAEVEARKTAKTEKRVFGTEAALAEQTGMPERLKMKQGTVTAQQMAVYDEFATKICGFKASTDDPTEFKTPLERVSDAEMDKFIHTLNILIRDLDNHLNAIKANPELRNNVAWQACTEIRNAVYHVGQNPRDSSTFHKLIGHSLEQLLYSYTNTYVSGGSGLDLEWSRRLRELFITVCQIILTQMTLQELSRKITQTIISSRMEHRFNVYAIEVLVRQRLLQGAAYDSHLAGIVDNGSLEAAIFATKLCKLIGGVEGMKHIFVKETFPKTIEAITKAMSMLGTGPTGDQPALPLQASPSVPPPAVVATSGAPAPPPTAPSAAGSSVTSASIPTPIGPDPMANMPQLQGREEDTPEMCGKVETILREWIALCYTPMAQKEPQQALATMIHLMHEQGVLATDEMITRFFRLCTELCIDVGYRLLKNDSLATTTVVRQRCYYTLDAFVKLTCLMVKHSDGSQHQTKINLLKKVLNIITSVLHNDHESKLGRGEFQAMPYHRMIIIMFNELTAPEASLEPIAWPILEAFGQAFFILQPRRCPGFAYAWLDIIGHRNVIARLLGDSVDPMRTAAMYTQLLICHLKFLAPFLRSLEMPKSIATLYKGTLRVLLVILHDFPELLCEYHYVICDTIPPNCVQLRNLVLSAYPRSMRLPDPFALTFKQVDAIAEMANDPKMCLNVNAIMNAELRQQLDHYLITRSSVDFLQRLPSFLTVSAIPGSKYNTTVVNAIVMYVGITAIESVHKKGLTVNLHSIAHSSFMDIFQNLTVQLDTEGRYLVFNAIANQLRYPNVHTHYFSCVFLFLFQHADSPIIKEQITRILFERLVALRPHPWGLLITFIELISNPQYNFWKNDFTRCAPEIERLFLNVANTCVSKCSGGGGAGGTGVEGGESSVPSSAATPSA